MAESDDAIFVTCEVCRLPFTGIEPYQQHLRGNKHWKALWEARERQRNMKTNPKFEDGKYCDICDVGVDDINEHLQEKEHLRMELENSKQVSLKCDVCNKAIRGVIPFQQHMKSGPHQRNVRKALMKERLADYLDDPSVDNQEMSSADVLASIGLHEFATCEVCLKEFGGPESYVQHMQSPAHKKKVIQQKLLLKIKEELEAGFEGYHVSLPGGSHGPEESGKEECVFKCHDCDKSFSGAIPFAQHINSKIHDRKVHQKKLLKELVDSLAQEEEGEGVLTGPERPEEEGYSSDHPAFFCSSCKIAFGGPESALAHYCSRQHAKIIKWRALLAQQQKKKATTVGALPSEEEKQEMEQNSEVEKHA